MKLKLVMGCLCIMLASTVHAQTEKGKKAIGGYITIDVSKNISGLQEVTTNSLSISPNLGYFIANNLQVGINIGVNSSTSKNYNETSAYINGSYTTIIQESTSKSKIMGGGPFIKYYIDLNEKFKFYGVFNASIGFGTNKHINNNSSIEVEAKSKNTNYGASIIPGFVFFPTKKLAFELSTALISYTKTDYKNPNFVKQESSSFRFGLSSFNPALGVNLHF